MTNVILPIAYFLMTVGKPIDLRTYNFGLLSQPIYNESDIVENKVSPSFNASYYVLDEDDFPFRKARVPIDLMNRIESEDYSSSRKDYVVGYRQLASWKANSGKILVVAEYQTSEKTVKENASPLPNWQDRVQKSQTHYADKIVYGGQVISVISVRSTIKSDAQVFRRIIKDVMGTSGRVTEDTVELWKKAEKLIRESPDVRGEVFMDPYTMVNGVKSAPSYGNENLFKYVSEFPKHVKTSHDDRYFRSPMYVVFKPLHDLDERFPALQKDVEGERYLTKLYRFMDDVERTESELKFLLRLISEENQLKYMDFLKELENLFYTLMKVRSSSLSAYEYIDKEAMGIAFAQYYRGLDNTTENYFSKFNRMSEKLASGITCGSDFFTPTRGVLRVADDEVVRKGKVESLEKCQDICVEDERCRAVGYSDRECLVYYRSTYSATITLLRGDAEDSKIYDRKCRFIYDDLH